VAVEPGKGALVSRWRKYECLHLYPVPSTMSASMREALYPSGAKDDPRDADLLLELLVLHRDQLRRLTPDKKPPGGYRIWWRSGASWWRKRRRS